MNNLEEDEILKLQREMDKQGSGGDDILKYQQNAEAGGNVPSEMPSHELSSREKLGYGALQALPAPMRSWSDELAGYLFDKFNPGVELNPKLRGDPETAAQYDAWKIKNDAGRAKIQEGARQEFSGKNEQFQSEHPIYSKAANIGGDTASALAMGVPAFAASQVAAGAGEGDTLEERAKNAGIGAAVGVGGGLAAAGLKGAAGIAGNLMRNPETRGAIGEAFQAMAPKTSKAFSILKKVLPKGQSQYGEVALQEGKGPALELEKRAISEPIPQSRAINEFKAQETAPKDLSAAAPEPSKPLDLNDPNNYPDTWKAFMRKPQ